jgi:hypothetical protein
MRIIVKCWTPEWYDAVSHAILDLSAEMVEKLLARIAAVNALKKQDDDIQSVEYHDYTPVFVDLGDPVCIGRTEEQMVAIDDGGWDFLKTDPGLEEVSMRPVTLHVTEGVGTKSGGSVYWQAYDKHGGAESRSDTYRLYETDLREILERINEGNG